MLVVVREVQVSFCGAVLAANSIRARPEYAGRAQTPTTQPTPAEARRAEDERGHARAPRAWWC